MVPENGKNRYELKKGDIVYFISASLPIMQNPELDSEKILTIPKGTEVNVIEVFDNGWSYIYSSFRNG